MFISVLSKVLGIVTQQNQSIISLFPNTSGKGVLVGVSFQHNVNPVVILLTLYISDGQTCNNGDIINGICYTIVRLSKTYDEAKKYCEDNGGFLASITDKTTQDGIDSLALKNRFPIPELWIGARETIDKQSDRVWKWISNGRVFYEMKFRDSNLI